MRRPGIRGTGPIRAKALELYEGEVVAHRSCGVALAEAFGRPPAAYVALRRGGLTGEGRCGAVLAGQLLLGELLGDPDSTAAVTAPLRRAMERFHARVEAELDRGTSPDLVCASLTAPHGDFASAERRRFCAQLVAQTAQLVDELVRAEGVDPSVVGASPAPRGHE